MFMHHEHLRDLCAKAGAPAHYLGGDPRQVQRRRSLQVNSPNQTAGGRIKDSTQEDHR
jgi:hypothetical protein